MDFLLTVRQQEVREQALKFARQEVEPFVKQIDCEDQFPSYLIPKLARTGLTGLPIPVEWGGRGSDFLSYILALEQISQVSAALGVILAVHTSVATMPILLYGTSEQKNRYVKPMARGELLGAFALTESSAGSDASKIKCRAQLQGDYYIINGSKMFITNLGAADIYILFAVQKEDSISAFILEKNMPGLEIGKLEKKMGLHGSNTGELILNNLRVPVGNRLGKEGQGYEIALSNLAAGRIGIGAQALGIAAAALEYLLKYVESAEKDERTLGYKREIAQSATLLEAARMLVYRAACEKDSGKLTRLGPAMAKMFASDLAVRITTRALDIAGHSLSLQRYFRDAKVTQIYEGTNEIQRIVIAKELLKR